MFGQSGGPTAVINASSCGVFEEALKHKEITEVYGLKNGIKGILKEEFYDIKREDLEELKFLKNTPSSAIGSVRYKLKPFTEEPDDYYKILEVFKKYNVRYFFYNGGNDSMDTCNKISKFLKSVDYECRVIGIPKTIDNDLVGTDHCPGYGSAAKYVATSVMELYEDTHVYTTQTVTVVEVMGRNAGWLTAAASLSKLTSSGADLIYLPEVVFSVDEFISDVQNVLNEKGNCLVIVSEGIKGSDGKYISEYQLSRKQDSFGHQQLGGLGLYLAGIVFERLHVKVRPIEFSLLQRCAAHLASQTDIDEAYMVGKKAVEFSLNGASDVMVGMNRRPGKTYEIDYVEVPLEKVANLEKKIPEDWFTEDKKGVNEKFIDYVLPLIQGEAKHPTKNGLPRYANLKKVLVTKK